jgi:hypothetical protein
MTSEVEPPRGLEVNKATFAKRLRELKTNVEAETRGVSEDQDYLRNDPFVYVPVSVRRDPRSYTKDGRLKDENTDTLRTTMEEC